MVQVTVELNKELEDLVAEYRYHHRKEITSKAKAIEHILFNFLKKKK